MAAYPKYKMSKIQEIFNKNLIYLNNNEIFG